MNLRNLYCTALFIQGSEKSCESEDPIVYCFNYSGIWGIQWIWGIYTVLLYSFSDLRNSVNLRNLYCTALFIQWSEKSCEYEDSIVYCFNYSVIWGILWIWGTYTVLLYLFSDWGIQWIWGIYTVLLQMKVELGFFRSTELMKQYSIYSSEPLNNWSIIVKIPQIHWINTAVLYRFF